MAFPVLGLIAATTLFAYDAIPGRKDVGDILAEAPAAAWLDADPGRTLYIDTTIGRIVVLLSADLAPGHVAQVKTLARERYYDGLHFYRVVEGFVAQGGDEAATRPKGSAAETLPAEFEEPFRKGTKFTPLGHKDAYAAAVGFIDGMPAGRDPKAGTAWLAHCTGAFAFGRDDGRDTASTEFYITLQSQRYLDRNLTVFGKVLLGMDVAQALPRGELNNGGVIEDKTRWTQITSIRLAADLPAAERVPVQYIDTNSDTFRALIDARAARPSSFFYFRPNHVDLCQMPVPVRLAPVAPAQ